MCGGAISILNTIFLLKNWLNIVSSTWQEIVNYSYQLYLTTLTVKINASHIYGNFRKKYLCVHIMFIARIILQIYMSCSCYSAHLMTS